MIQLDQVFKSFGGFAALDGVSLSIAEGELVALLGPSGSGKTTLLRIIAGLEFPDSGSVLFDGGDLTRAAARDRRVGFVFQHYALFRHMTVFDNVAFGLTVRSRATRPGKAEIAERVHRLLHLVQLDGLAYRYPSQLSGGQRQRVALARALAIEPRMLLLDEPFGALDARVRKELRRWLRRLHDDLKITGVFVTHDQEEALEVADRVVVMNRGRIEQVGTPSEIYDQPATPFVYQFLGNVNAINCRITGGVARAGGLTLPAAHLAYLGDSKAVAFLRPHDIAIEPSLSGQGTPAVIRYLSVLGPLVRIEAEVGDQSLDIEITRQSLAELQLKIGQVVLLSPRNPRFFLEDDGEAVIPDATI